MKLLFTIFILTVAYTSFSQTSKIDFQLDTIQDYRIKIDGGCGIYHFQNHNPDATSLKDCFVIDQFKRAFFAIKNQYDHIYVKRIKNEHLKNGFYREIFSGRGFKCTLTTKNSSLTDKSLRKGILEISNSKNYIKIEVLGNVDYKP